MGPKPPDWNYLVSLELDNLEEEDVEKVLHINIQSPTDKIGGQLLTAITPLYWELRQK